MKTGFSFIFVILSGLFLTTSCYYDNEEELYPQVVCDTFHVTYTNTISPIVVRSCNSCHGTASPSAGVVTDTWQGLNAIALDGRLWGVVNHEAGFPPMPQGQEKLPDCDLSKIRIWIAAGAPEN